MNTFIGIGERERERERVNKFCALALSLFFAVALFATSFIPQQAFADEWRTVTQTTHVNFEFSDGFVPPDAENTGNAAATLAETGDILPIALAILAVGGCGVATFVLISRRNVVANSGSHVGVSSVSNSMIKKAGILALAATLALTSAFSFSKAFAGVLLGGGEIHRALDENGYQIPREWDIKVDVNDLGKVTYIKMSYPEVYRGEQWEDYAPIRLNHSSYQWIYSLFPEGAQNNLSHGMLDEGTPNLYPFGVYYDWYDIVEEFPGEDYSLREDLINDAYYNGGFDIEIPFEQQTKFDWTFDYGYEGSTPYVATIDWRDVNLGNDLSTYVNVPAPVRAGYEFTGWTRKYGEGWEEWEGPAFCPLDDITGLQDINNFVYQNRWGDVTGFVAQWKQADSTNDINANDGQTDSADTDLNADATDVDTQDAVSEQNTGEFAQSDENNADLVGSADLDTSAVKED